jgi:hypothetical protein
MRIASIDLKGVGRPWGIKKVNKWLEEIENKNGRKGECQKCYSWP